MIKNISKIHLTGLFAIFTGFARAADQDPNHIRYVVTENQTSNVHIQRFFQPKNNPAAQWQEDVAAKGSSTAEGAALAFSQLRAQVQDKRDIDLWLDTGEERGGLKKCDIKQPQPVSLSPYDKWEWDERSQQLLAGFSGRFVAYTFFGAQRAVLQMPDRAIHQVKQKLAPLKVGGNPVMCDQSRGDKAHTAAIKKTPTWTTKNYLQAAGLTLGFAACVAVAWDWYKSK